MTVKHRNGAKAINNIYRLTIYIYMFCLDIFDQLVGFY